MRIAVIGAGIFGCTAAIHAARAGHEVHLYEKAGMLFPAASSINQYRLHRGYHYPRSPATGRACRLALDDFMAEYRQAVIGGGTHLYAVAHDMPTGRLTAAEYLEAIEPLPYSRRDGRGFNAVDLVIEAAEDWLDPERLRRLADEKLWDARVHVHLNRPAPAGLRWAFDTVIVAAYAGSNAALAELGLPAEVCQFEVCEVPVVRLPPEWRLTGLVVMDGEFPSFAPLGNTGLHVVAHVNYAIHRGRTARAADIPDWLVEHIDNGVVPCGRIVRLTHFERIRKAIGWFVPALYEMEHIGSMFTVKAVLPDRNDTDERPTLVDRLDDKVIRILGGKIGTCVTAAKQAMVLIDRKTMAAA